MKQFLLLYSHTNEPVTQALLSKGFCALSVEEFLSSVEVMDEISEGIPKISWTLKNGVVVNNRDWIIINRVLSISEDFFRNFVPEDRAYALAEVRAYFQFSLTAFESITERPGSHGLSGNRFSLPQQWSMVEDTIPALSIPQYEMGLLSDQENTVNSSIYNYYLWRPGYKKETCFGFIKPKGVPILGSFFGTTAFTTPLDSQERVNSAVGDRLEGYICDLKRLFEFWIGECLFFVDGQTITFGMISNIPYATKKLPTFNQRVFQAVDQLEQENDHSAQKSYEEIPA